MEQTTTQSQQTKKGFKPEWKAWINLMMPRESSGGTLYVTGSIDVGPEKIKYQLRKSDLQGTTPHELILDVEPGPTNGTNIFPLLYDEDLKDEDQYTSVRVRTEGREDIVIPEIYKV